MTINLFRNNFKHENRDKLKTIWINLITNIKHEKIDIN